MVSIKLSLILFAVLWIGSSSAQYGARSSDKKEPLIVTVSFEKNDGTVLTRELVVPVEYLTSGQQGTRFQYGGTRTRGQSRGGTRGQYGGTGRTSRRRQPGYGPRTSQPVCDEDWCPAEPQCPPECLCPCTPTHECPIECISNGCPEPGVCPAECVRPECDHDKPCEDYECGGSGTICNDYLAVLKWFKRERDTTTRRRHNY